MTNPLVDDKVTFIQHQLPGLDDGEYQLTVSQRVLDGAGQPVNTDTVSATYTFAVLGDRFTIADPQKTVTAVFPPQDATGQFTTVLPHVVLAKPTLPWARYPTMSVGPFKRPKPPLDLDADVPTWLAVLLLDEDDAREFPGLSLTPAAAKIGDLFPARAVAQSTLGGNYSYFHEATDTSDLDPGQRTDDPIRVLDVPLSLFWRIAPTLDDLSCTAHVRQVSVTNKPTGPSRSRAAQDADPPLGTFSIVFGTRLPQTGRKAHAYLVSLERLQAFLPDAAQGGAPSGSNFDGTRSLRLAVLTSWTFFSTGEQAAFVDRLLALNGNTGQGPVNTNLCLPYAGTNAVVAAALGMGYVPLDETLRTGGNTVSWYRGPLVPYPVTQRSIELPISAPDQATIFDPTTGMLDVSYAAAWTLGRMLALQDAGFSTALYQWKRGLSQQVVQAVENAILAATFSDVLPPQDGAEAAPPTARALLHQTIRALASLTPDGP